MKRLGSTVDEEDDVTSQVVPQLHLLHLQDLSSTLKLAQDAARDHPFDFEDPRWKAAGSWLGVASWSPEGNQMQTRIWLKELLVQNCKRYSGVLRDIALIDTTDFTKQERRKLRACPSWVCFTKPLKPHVFKALSKWNTHPEWLSSHFSLRSEEEADDIRLAVEDYKDVSGEMSDLFKLAVGALSRKKRMRFTPSVHTVG